MGIYFLHFQTLSNCFVFWLLKSSMILPQAMKNHRVKLKFLTRPHATVWLHNMTSIEQTGMIQIRTRKIHVFAYTKREAILTFTWNHFQYWKKWVKQNKIGKYILSYTEGNAGSCEDLEKERNSGWRKIFELWKERNTRQILAIRHDHINDPKSLSPAQE